MSILKKKALGLFEKQFGKMAEVLEVRVWDPATFFEVDLHLPGVDMDKWQSVQHMKCKVAESTYRDYTPANWNAETQTCTLFVDAGHDGYGSKWVAGLKEGEQILYLGISTTFTKPLSASTLFCLGDSSAIGHFLALEQLAGRANVTGALVIREPEHRSAFQSFFDSALQAIPQRSKSNIDNLHNWLIEQQFSDAAVYLAGHVPMVVELRKKIKALPGFKGPVKVQGFWW
jgi:NADPH-dependent ferric siderophore reductase